jgi:hypothetical protein
MPMDPYPVILPTSPLLLLTPQSVTAPLSLPYVSPSSLSLISLPHLSPLCISLISLPYVSPSSLSLMYLPHLSPLCISLNSLPHLSPSSLLSLNLSHPIFSPPLILSSLRRLKLVEGKDCFILEACFADTVFNTMGQPFSKPNEVSTHTLFVPFILLFLLGGKVTSLQRCEMLFSVVSSALCDATPVRGVTEVT